MNENNLQHEMDGPLIVATPGIGGSRPRIRGTRVRVVDILDMLASGMSSEQIAADYPYISIDDIVACLRYARSFCN